MSDATTCSACDALGQTPTPEHAAGVARFDAQMQAAESLEAENARLRERVADLETQNDLLEDDVLYLQRRATALRAGVDAVHAEIAGSAITDERVAALAFASLSDLRRADEATIDARAALAEQAGGVR